MGGAGRPGQTRPGSGGGFGLVVFLNQGDGTWVRQDGKGEKGKLFGDDFEVADFTATGVQISFSDRASWVRKTLLRIGSDGGSWQAARLDLLRPASLVGAVDAADFNGDGRIDLAWVTWPARAVSGGPGSTCCSRRRRAVGSGGLFIWPRGASG